MAKVLLTPAAASDLKALPEVIHCAMIGFLDFLVAKPEGGKPQIGIPKTTKPKRPARLGGYALEYRVVRGTVYVDKMGRLDWYKNMVYSARTAAAAGKLWLDEPFDAGDKLPKAKVLEDDPPVLPKPDAQGNVPAIEYGRALLAQKIMRRRQAVGLLQRELAEWAEVPPETLHRVERAKLTSRPATITRIIQGLEQAEEEFREKGTLQGGLIERARLAAEVQRLRKEAGMSEAELAKKAGLVPLTVHMLEEGDRVPHAGTVKRIMKVFRKLGLKTPEVTL